MAFLGVGAILVQFEGIWSLWVYLCRGSCPIILVGDPLGSVVGHGSLGSRGSLGSLGSFGSLGGVHGFRPCDGDHSGKRVLGRWPFGMRVLSGSAAVGSLAGGR